MADGEKYIPKEKYHRRVIPTRPDTPIMGDTFTDAVAPEQPPYSHLAQLAIAKISFLILNRGNK